VSPEPRIQQTMTLEQMRDQANKAKSDLLFSDAELALTFLDLADSTKIEEDRERRLREAKRAYDSISQMLPTVYLTAQQRTLMNQRLDAIKARLQRGRPRKHAVTV
jgi:hypothetical protein